MKLPQLSGTALQPSPALFPLHPPVKREKLVQGSKGKLERKRKTRKAYRKRI